MSRNLIIGIIAFLVVGGTATYLVMQDDDVADDVGQAVNEATENSPVFNATSTNDKDFVGTITSNSQEGAVTFAYDHDTNSFRYTATGESGTIETITTPDAYYAMADDQWVKYPTGTDSAFDPSSYQYDQDELSQYSGANNYVGTEDCATGTCHVWRYTIDNYQSSLFVDTATGYVVRVETNNNGQTSSIDYSYEEVNITPPADAQEIELPS